MVDPRDELPSLRCVSFTRLRRPGALPLAAPSVLLVSLGGPVTLALAENDALALAPRDVLWLPASRAQATRVRGGRDLDLLLAALHGLGPRTEGGAGPIHLRSSTATRGAADLVVRALAAELRAPRPGQRAAIRSLLEALATHVLPRSGAVDRGIARALAAVVRAPATAWTVERLAQLAGASRAAFARRFEREVGEPPRRHLARVRLELAAEALITTDDALAAIAARVGYASEFALAKAFKRHFGVAPGRYRRARTSAPTMMRAA